MYVDFLGKKVKTCYQDFPGGPVVRNPPATAGGTWVGSLIRENSTCLGATMPMRHNY